MITIKRDKKIIVFDSYEILKKMRKTRQKKKKKTKIT